METWEESSTYVGSVLAVSFTGSFNVPGIFSIKKKRDELITPRPLHHIHLSQSHYKVVTASHLNLLISYEEVRLVLADSLNKYIKLICTKTSDKLKMTNKDTC